MMELDTTGKYSHTPLSSDDLSHITDGDYQMIFVTLDTPDYAGHYFGFEPDSEMYIEAIETVDS